MKTAQLLIIGALISTLLSISGCGGGDITPAGDDNTAPLVTSTTPLDNATSVAANSSITATFNEDILADSISNANFTLSNGSTSVSATTSYDVSSKTATLTPSQNMNVLDTYTARLTNNVSDIRGNAYLGSSWSFTTADGTWGAAELLETEEAGNATQVQIATDSNGGAVAVWLQHDGTRNNLMARIHASDSGWGTTVLIDNVDTEIANAASVAMDSSGNIIIVWSQIASGVNNIFYNRYVVSEGWKTALPFPIGGSTQARVVMDNNGNAIAIWKQDSGTNDRVSYLRYSSGAWQDSPNYIDNTTTDAATDIRIAMDSSGNAIAVWVQNDAGSESIRANRYTAAGDSWGGDALIETINLGDASSPEIAFDNSGNAIVVWTQSNGLIVDIWSNRYSGTWGIAEIIDDGSSDADKPSIAVDSSGNAIAVWQQNGDAIANRYVLDGDWETPSVLDIGSGAVSGGPQVVIDSSGNATAVWEQYDGTRNNINFNRFIGVGTNNTDWSGALPLESNDSGNAENAKLAVSNNNSVIAVWDQETTGIHYNAVTSHFE